MDIYTIYRKGVRGRGRRKGKEGERLDGDCKLRHTVYVHMNVRTDPDCHSTK